MTARILESTPRPFERPDVDPITLDIIENALRNARFEMDAVLFRHRCDRTHEFRDVDSLVLLGCRKPVGKQTLSVPIDATGSNDCSGESIARRING